VEVRATHIPVDQNDLAGAQLGERDREVGDERRLPVLGLEGSHHDRLRGVVGRRVEEARAKVAEGFGEDRRHLEVRDEREGFGLGIARGERSLLSDAAPIEAAREGMRPRIGTRSTFSTSRASLIIGVQVLEEEGEPDPTDEPAHAGEEQVQAPPGSGGVARDLRAVTT